MLFEVRLRAKESYYSKDWGEVPLNYGELKQLIYGTPEISCSNELENPFFTCVKKEIPRINKSVTADHCTQDSQTLQWIRRLLKLAKAVVREHGRRGLHLFNDSEKRNGSFGGFIHGWDLRRRFGRDPSQRSPSRVRNEFARVHFQPN